MHSFDVGRLDYTCLNCELQLMANPISLFSCCRVAILGDLNELDELVSQQQQVVVVVHPVQSFGTFVKQPGRSQRGVRREQRKGVIFLMFQRSKVQTFLLLSGDPLEESVGLQRYRAPQ